MTGCGAHVPAGEARYAAQWLETGKRYFSPELLGPLWAALVEGNGPGPYPVERGPVAGEPSLTQRVRASVEEHLREHPWATAPQVTAALPFPGEKVLEALSRGVREGVLQRAGGWNPRCRYALVGVERPKPPLTLKERLTWSLATTAKTPKELSLELGVSAGSVYGGLRRLRSDKKVTLGADGRYSLAKGTPPK